VRKIVTIVAAVAVVVFVLMQFPGLTENQENMFKQRGQQALNKFLNSAAGTGYAGRIQDRESVLELIRFQQKYKQARKTVSSREESERVNKRFEALDPEFFAIVKRGKKPREARKLGRSFKSLVRERKSIRREIHSARIDSSFLGQIGRTLEPVTQWAGFNWRINVSILSALAAKESLVATLGSIYQQDEGSDQTLGSRMKEQEKGFTPLHALALILFMVLYPPCLATLMAIKLQTTSYKWMLFSLTYQLGLGIFVASLVFTGSRLLGLSGLQAMFGFFALMVLTTILVGFIKNTSTTINQETGGQNA
jgi:ferrous iron transport protein B